MEPRPIILLGQVRRLGQHRVQALQLLLVYIPVRIMLPLPKVAVAQPLLQRLLPQARPLVYPYRPLTLLVVALIMAA